MRRIHKDLVRAHLQRIWSTIHMVYKEDATGAFSDVLANIENALSALDRVSNKCFQFKR